MKKGNIDTKIQSSGHKKSLSTIQSPINLQDFKSIKNLNKSSKESTPQGFNFQSRNNSQLNFKPLYDALTQLCSQSTTPIARSDLFHKESNGITPLTSARRKSNQQSCENSLIFKNKEQLISCMQEAPIAQKTENKKTSQKPNSSQKILHKKSLSADLKPQESALGVQTKIPSSKPNSTKNSSSISKHAKTRSLHTSPLKLVSSPVNATTKNSKTNKQKGIGSFSNVFVKPKQESQSRPGSRRASDNKGDLHLNIEELSAPQLPLHKINLNKPAYLSQRDEVMLDSMISSQMMGSKTVKNSSSSSKLDLTNQFAKDHRRVFEANFKNICAQAQDPSLSSATTPTYLKSASQARLISEIVDVVHDNKKAGKFANNQALQSVFNKVGKYVSKTKQQNAIESSNASISQRQLINNDRNQLSSEVVLNRRGSLNTVNPLQLGFSNYIVPAFNRISNGKEEAGHPVSKNSENDIICSYSRSSSQGMLSKGLNSVIASKENSPRATTATTQQKKASAKSNEIKKSTITDLIKEKILKLSNSDVNSKLSQALMKKEENVWKKKKPQPTHHENDQDSEISEEFMKVYKNFNEENGSFKNSTNKTHSASTEDDSKSSVNRGTKTNCFQMTKTPTNKKVTQASSKEKIEKESKSKAAAHEEAKVNRPSAKGGHKKNSKSVNTANAVEMMLKGIQLPVNLHKLENSKLLTPELSKRNSLNNSRESKDARQSFAEANEPNNYNIPIIRLSTNEDDYESAVANARRRKNSTQDISSSEFEKIRNAFKAQQSENGVQQTPDSSIQDIQTKTSDESVLRERLIRLIKEHFKNQSKIPTTTLDYYRIVKMIGKGAFGKVYLGKHLLTGQKVAIKSINKQYMKDEHSRKKVFQEVLILKKCNHKNIIKLLEVFENQKYLFIVQEYASEGDLLSYVKERGRICEDEAKNIFLQVVDGIRYCHKQSILHRDIKLDNILLAKGTSIKICDFGVSRFVKPGQMIREQCGTPAYIAPEILIDKGYEGCFADVWSLGVLLYAIITGGMPFLGDDIDELHQAVVSGKFSLPAFLTDGAKDLITKLLKLNPYSRILIEDVENHPWFGNTKKLEDQLTPNSKSLRSGSNSSKNLTILDKRKLSKNDQFSTNSSKIDSAIVKRVEALGFPKEHIIQSVESNSCTHASACYFLIQQNEK